MIEGNPLLTFELVLDNLGTHLSAMIGTQTLSANAKGKLPDTMTHKTFSLRQLLFMTWLRSEFKSLRSVGLSEDVALF